MTRYMVEKNYVRVVGDIWQPGVGKCAMEYTLDRADVENIGDFTKENVEAWLKARWSDFQSIDDYNASIGDQDIPWHSEESECLYWDCVSPAEE